MSQDKSPVDQAIELFVFAPLGLAITAREALPSLIERGRQQVTGQTTMAKMVGQFAVQEGQRRAASAFGDARQQAATVFEQFTGDGGHGRHGANGNGTTANGASNGSAVATSAATPAPSRPTPPQSSGSAAADLAIPDYDSLAASQVVPRLSGLTPDELEQVRVYEAGHRGRKTILSRVAQLQADR